MSVKRSRCEAAFFITPKTKYIDYDHGLFLVK